MQNLWPFDGWVIVVSNDNGFQGSSLPQPNLCKWAANGANNNDESCYDHWYTGCRENPIQGSSSKRE